MRPPFRFIHTADWHLGQALHGYERLPEHKAFFDWLANTIHERKPDALVVAGDVFDSINPSAAPQKLLYSFFARAIAAHPALQIILTAGNHDSAARLEAPNPILENFNIHIVGTLPRSDGAFLPEKTIFPLRDATGTVAALCIAIPFLRPGDLPRSASGEPLPPIEGVRKIYADALASALKLRDEKHPGAAILALGHCHIAPAGAGTDESEHPVIIGGADALPLDIFPPEIAYVALGHIHRAQSFDSERIRYSGSPIPLSFSETGYQHQVLEITLAADAPPSCESLPVPRHADFLRVPASAAAAALPLEELLPQLATLPLDASLPEDRWPFLEIRVLDNQPDPTRVHRIRQALENRAVRLGPIRSERPATASTSASDADSTTPGDSDNLDALTPEKLLNEVWQSRYGADTRPSEAVLTAFNEILNDLRAQAPAAAQ